MSWDVWLAAHVGRDSGPVQLAETDWNYTSNAGPMLAFTMGWGSMSALDGLSGQEAAELLDQAVCGLEVDEVRCRELEPQNGWGSYDTFLDAMRRLLDIASQHPRAVVGTWC
jgi:hypothetical protein